ncbi:MAG: RsmG family class I SAM-dependent methyltransferase [Acidimicrobiia bacterium]
MSNSVTRALVWIGGDANDVLLRKLDTYRDWLTTEALRAGGIGPDEVGRIDSRHLADSLLFAGVWDRQSTRPVLDVGTGVGLPGIPLALAAPDRPFVLLDRSGRRIQLLRRATRVLGLENVDVVQGDLGEFDWAGHTVVARASLSPARLLEWAEATGRPEELLVGGSHRQRPDVPGFVTVEIPSEILAWPVWILRMAQ